YFLEDSGNTNEIVGARRGTLGRLDRFPRTIGSTLFTCAFLQQKRMSLLDCFALTVPVLTDFIEPNSLLFATDPLADLDFSATLSLQLACLLAGFVLVTGFGLMVDNFG